MVGVFVVAPDFVPSAVFFKELLNFYRGVLYSFLMSCAVGLGISASEYVLIYS